MMRGMTALWVILAAGIGIGLFLLKYEVQAQEDHLSQINRQIHNDQEAIHVLKAEWSYLNDPTRLRDMAEKHLNMHSMRPAQIASLHAIPLDDRPTQDLSSKALAEIAPLPEPPKRGKTTRMPPPAAAVPAPAPAPLQEAPAAPPQLMVKAQPTAPAPSAPAAIPVAVAAAKPVQPKPAPIPVAAVKAPAAPKPAPQPPAFRPAEAPYPAPTVQAAAPVARPKPAPVLPPVAISSQTQAAPANSGYSRPYGVVGPGGYTAAPPAAPMGGGNVLIIKSPALRDGEGDAR